MKYVVEVSVEELGVIAAGLNELPRKVSQPVFSNLQEQVSAQDAARGLHQPPPAEEPAPPELAELAEPLKPV